MEDQVILIENDDIAETKEAIENLLRNKKIPELKKLLSRYNSVDIALVLQELEEKDLPIVFRLIDSDEAADVFVEMDADSQEKLIRVLSDKELKEVVDDMYVDDAADIAAELPTNVVRRLLKQASPDTRADINKILSYPENSAGSLMTTEFVSVRANNTVEQAFDKIRRVGLESETVYTLYVTDDKRRLIGIVSAKDLLLSESDSLIKDIMTEEVIYSNTLEDKEDIAKTFAKYDFIALPVVDKEKRLVGIVTVDDAMSVMEEEVEEDFSLMAGVAPNEEDYLDTSVVKHYSKRIIWILILMISGIFSGLIIERYESAFIALPLLISFIPRLMDTSGNCGSQSSTTIIRALATDEIKTKDFFKIIAKETGISLLIGLTLALVNAPIVYLMYMNSGINVLRLCILFGSTLMLVVLLANILGGTLPIVAKLLKIDPAMVASPLITTIMDVVSTLLYFIIAVAMFGLV